LEGDFHSLDACSLCGWWRRHSKPKLAVRISDDIDKLGIYCIYSYRHVPTFGRDTIRRFHKNASAMKKLAARDFEDLLQVCILLPQVC
jgi:hypothetical protein